MPNIQYNVHIVRHAYSICRSRHLGTTVKSSCLNHCCLCVLCGDKNCHCLKNYEPDRITENHCKKKTETKQQTLRPWRHHKQEQAKVALLIPDHKRALRPKPCVFSAFFFFQIPQSVIALKCTRRELYMIYWRCCRFTRCENQVDVTARIKPVFEAQLGAVCSALPGGSSACCSFLIQNRTQLLKAHRRDLNVSLQTCPSLSPDVPAGL